MANFSRVSDEDLRELVRWWGALQWPISPTQLLGIAAERSWELLGERKNGGALWDTGLMEFRPWASSSVVDGDVTGLTVSSISARNAKDGDADGDLRDAFVDQVEVLAAVLGDASEKSPGAVGLVTWTLANGSTVSLGGVGTLYSCEVTSPAFTQTLEDAGRLDPSA